MKQHITSKQFSELSKEAKKKLIDWWKPRDGDKICSDVCTIVSFVEPDTIFYSVGRHIFETKKSDLLTEPLLSIGQMIEFLDENRDGLKITKQKEWMIWAFSNYAGRRLISKKEEFRDALWIAVKEVLNETNK